MLVSLAKKDCPGKAFAVVLVFEFIMLLYNHFFLKIVSLKKSMSKCMAYLLFRFLVSL